MIHSFGTDNVAIMCSNPLNCIFSPLWWRCVLLHLLPQWWEASLWVSTLATTMRAHWHNFTHTAFQFIFDIYSVYLYFVRQLGVYRVYLYCACALHGISMLGWMAPVVLTVGGECRPSTWSDSASWASPWITAIPRRSRSANDWALHIQINTHTHTVGND